MADLTRASRPLSPAGRSTTVEIELKFDAPADFVLPDLGSVPGVRSVAAAQRYELDATYFDTEDLRLVAHKITLRRRTGGKDAGWHLKRPRSDGDRDEVRAPLGRATRVVPAPLRHDVQVFARGAALVPVARLVTGRTVHLLLGKGGRVLAEVAEDDVTTFAPGGRRGAPVQSWHELEVELVDGDRALLAAVAELLEAAGATVSASPSKLSRALGDRRGTSARSQPTPPAARSAAAIVLAHLGEHVERLLAFDPKVRRDEPDGVHQMRVATRRLRSALATYRRLLDRERTEPLRAELAWLAGVLGEARDAEVIRDHLIERVAAEPAECVIGPVIDRITDTMQERYRVAHSGVLAALDSDRYFALLAALDRMLADPPLTSRAADKASAVLPPLIRRTYTRLEALVRAAHAATDPQEHDLLLHDVRKAAKKARYAGESLVASRGKAARRWASRMAGLQEVLGDHQDSVVIREEILALAALAAAAGEDTFTYGRLHAHEESRGAVTEARFEQAWQRLRDPAVHRWLD